MMDLFKFSKLVLCFILVFFFSYGSYEAKTRHYKLEVNNEKLNCSLVSFPSSNATCSTFVLTVAPRRTCRLQIGSLSSPALSFEVEGHNMTVVELNGTYVEPFVKQILHIYPGEKYSVLIGFDQDPSRNYWVTANVIVSNSSTPPRLAILNHFPDQPNRCPPTTQTTGPFRNYPATRLAQSLSLKAREDYNNLPQKPNRDLICRNNDMKNVIKNLDTTSSERLHQLSVNSLNSNSALLRIFARRLSTSHNDTTSDGTVVSILNPVAVVLGILSSAITIYSFSRSLCHNNNNVPNGNNNIPNGDNGNNNIHNNNNQDDHNQQAANSPFSEIENNNASNNHNHHVASLELAQLDQGMLNNKAGM